MQSFAVLPHQQKRIFSPDTEHPMDFLLSSRLKHQMKCASRPSNRLCIFRLEMFTKTFVVKSPGWCVPLLRQSISATFGDLRKRLCQDTLYKKDLWMKQRKQSHVYLFFVPRRKLAESCHRCLPEKEVTHTRIICACVVCIHCIQYMYSRPVFRQV